MLLDAKLNEAQALLLRRQPANEDQPRRIKVLRAVVTSLCPSYLYFWTSKASKVRSKVLDGPQGMPHKLLSCEYLYFCTITASKLSEHLDEFAGDGRQFNAAICAGADARIAPLRLHVVLFKLLHVQLLLRIQLVPHLDKLTA